MKLDTLTEIRRTQTHEKAVKQFLTSVNVAEEYINYDNFKLFADAKKTIDFNTVSNNDTRVLNKFCKRWIQQKGNISPKDIRRIQNKVVHYAHKEQNLALRSARLQRRKTLN
jgi:hypothetical protein